MADYASDVANISRYGKENYDGVFECSYTPTKGRILHSTRSFKQGEVILTERPLHIVQVEPKLPAFQALEKLVTTREDDFDFEPLWYWCALRSLTTDQLKGAREGGWTGASDDTQRNLLLLHHEDFEEPTSAAKILAKELAPGASAELIERLVQVWVLNCFEYSDNPQGYSAYFFTSFMSHSCFPNVFWHYKGDNHVLRARRDIAVGDEVCISYLTEDWLLQSGPARRWDLHETKHFWCACERCDGVLDTSRGFLCPACKKGVVFGRAPGNGAAADDNAPATDLIGCECESCGHKLTRKEAERLTNVEKSFKKTVERLTQTGEFLETGQKITAEDAVKIEALIEESFQQHVLADHAWEHLLTFYVNKRRKADQLRLLERRCRYAGAAYPGVSAAHAWALEGYGDAVRKDAANPTGSAATSSRARGRGRGGGTVSYSIEAKRKAKGLYEEALDILRLMFGTDHEYVVGLDRKDRELAEELSRKDAGEADAQNERGGYSL